MATRLEESCLTRGSPADGLLQSIFACTVLENANTKCHHSHMTPALNLTDTYRTRHPTANRQLFWEAPRLTHCSFQAKNKSFHFPPSLKESDRFTCEGRNAPDIEGKAQNHSFQDAHYGAGLQLQCRLVEGCPKYASFPSWTRKQM